MQIELKRIKEGLTPLDDKSVEAISKLNIGDVIIVDYKPKRNVKFHRKYWALLRAVLPNQDRVKTEQQLHEIVKYRAGYFETMFDLRGNEFVKTSSISFDKMDENEFEQFYSHALDVALELVGEEAVNDILRFI